MCSIKSTSVGNICVFYNKIYDGIVVFFGWLYETLKLFFLFLKNCILNKIASVFLIEKEFLKG